MTDLPSGWEWATLRDVAEWGSGGTPRTKNHEYYNGSIPWAVIGDLNDAVVEKTANTITEKGLRESAAKLVPVGSVLIAMYGSIGKLGLSGVEMATNQAIAFAQANRIEPKYLFWYLMSQQRLLSQVGKGATQRNISQTVLHAWPIPVAPAVEQRRIVAALEDHLSRLDSGRVSAQSAGRRLEHFRDQLIAAGCAGSLVRRESAGAPPPAHVGVDDGSLPRIPQHWRWARLHEIADVVGGITKDSKKQSASTLITVPYLRVANVQRGQIDVSNVTTIKTSKEKIEQLALRPGDVLLNEGGDRDKLARGWVWEGQLPLCIHQNHVFRARVKNGVLDPKILAWHANSFGKIWAEANGKQSVNLASISLSKIRLLPVPVPPKSEQPKIVEMIEQSLDAVTRLVVSVLNAENRAGQLRRSLLADAFAGRLVPQDPNDEPASVLLERIRAERAAQPKPKRARRGRNTTQEGLL